MNKLSLTRTVGPPPEQLGPLSPDEFGGSDAGNTSSISPVTTGEGPNITTSDIATLAQVRISIKEARVAMGSADKKVATAGRRQIAVMVSYLIGFLDGRGLIASPYLASGFDRLVGDAMRPTEEEALDELERTLDQLLAVAVTDPNTRGWLRSLGSFLSTLGDVSIQLGVTIIGVTIAK